MGITPKRIVKVSSMERELFVDIVADVLDAQKNFVHGCAIWPFWLKRSVLDRKGVVQAGRILDHTTRGGCFWDCFGQCQLTGEVCSICLSDLTESFFIIQNIEAVCHGEAEIRHEIRQTVLHELGH